EKPLDDIKDERPEIKADLSKAESKIADIMIDVEELNQKIDREESCMKENTEKVTANEEKIEEYQTEREELETEIAELEEVMEESAETLKERLAAYQENGGQPTTVQVILENLFNADGFNPMKAISKAKAQKTITGADMALNEDQEADKEKVEEKQTTVSDKLAKQEDEKAEVKAIQETLEDQESDLQEDKKEEKDKKQK